MYSVNHEMQLCLTRVNLASLPPRTVGMTNDNYRLLVQRHLSGIFKAWNFGEIAWIEINSLPDYQNTVRINIFMSNWYPSFYSFMLQRQLDWTGSATLDLANEKIDIEPRMRSESIWRWTFNIYYPTLNSTVPLQAPVLRRS